MTAKLTLDRKLAIAALVISILSALFAGVSAFISGYDVFRPGTVSPIAPAGYALIRGDGSFHSDILVLPIEWENTRGKSALIRHPALVLHELDPKGQPTGSEIKYVLAGEYAEISTAAFSGKMALKYSFIQESQSIGAHVLAFHYARWWDDEDKNHDFQFKGGTTYRVSILYQVNGEKEQELVLFDLPILKRVDELVSDRQKAWWDYFYLR